MFLSSGSAGFPVGSQAQCTGAGRQWGRTSWGNIPGVERRGTGGQWSRTSWGRTSWGRKSVGQDVVGQKFVGQDVTGAISWGQEVTGAGSRESLRNVNITDEFSRAGQLHFHCVVHGHVDISQVMKSSLYKALRFATLIHCL